MIGPNGIRNKMDYIDSKIRTLERRTNECELREKQLIIMFKMIMDKSLNNQGRRIKITDIINYMEQLINKNLTPDEQRLSPDLISQLIKKQY